MEFKTQYNGRVRRVSNPGSEIHETFVGCVDDKGRISLKKSGQENIYDMIQSHAQSVDINVIMKRFTQGDTSALQKVQGFYGDVTQFPGSYSQMLNAVEDGKRHFESLPLEIRERFDHNFSQFMEAVFDGSVISKLGKDDPIGKKSDPQPNEE